MLRDDPTTTSRQWADLTMKLVKRIGTLYFAIRVDPGTLAQGPVENPPEPGDDARGTLMGFELF